jgi:putative DNA primase/helicase
MPQSQDGNNGFEPQATAETPAVVHQLEHDLTAPPLGLESQLPHCFILTGDAETIKALRISRKNAGEDAVWDPELGFWCFRQRETAEAIAKKNSRTNAKLGVRQIPMPEIARMKWLGTRDEKRRAGMMAKLHIQEEAVRSASERLSCKCTKGGIYPQQLGYEAPKSWSEQDRKLHGVLQLDYRKLQELEDSCKMLQADIDDMQAEGINRDQDLDAALFFLGKNELGDAELFVRTFPGKYVFDSSEGSDGAFYFWNGTSWQRDDDRQRYTDMAQIAVLYEQAEAQLKENPDTKKMKEALIKRAFAVRSARRCHGIFTLLRSLVPFKGEWDHCPGLLPCLNGVIDLKTGNLLQHAPERYLRHICPTPYHENAASPIFDKFILDIMEDNQSLADFLLRCLGYALLGHPREEKVFLFHGTKGRNGKGTLFQTLERVLGPFARTFPSEMLLLQRNPPSSSNASPDLASLQGVRFAIFSETTKRREIDSSKVKNLRGGDTISCRRLFSNTDLQIRPTFSLFIQTNYLPEMSSNDEALWKSVLIIPFKATFTEEDPKDGSTWKKADPKIKDKLLEELKGILATLVKASLKYQENGLQTPKVVLQETQNYRNENDGLEAFISQECEKGSYETDKRFSVPCRVMQNQIKKFCREHGFEQLNMQEVVSGLGLRKFKRIKLEKGWIWAGVRIREEVISETSYADFHNG